MPRRLVIGLALLLSFVGFATRAQARSTSDTAVALSPSERPISAPTTVDAEAERRFLNRINRARADRGLPALLRDDALGDLARFHSADMAIRGFVGLTSPSEGSLLDRAAAVSLVSVADVTAQVASGSDLSQVGAPLLEPSARRVGVGIVRVAGRLFLTQLAIAGAAPQGYTAGDATPARVIPVFLGRIRDVLDQAIRVAPSRLAFTWR